MTLMDDSINMNDINGIGRNTFFVGFMQPNLDAHWNKHFWQYKGISKKQYANTALDLIQSACGGNIRGYVRENGQIIRYNRSTNDYVVGNNDGRSGIPIGIATMYKLDELKYEQRMKEEAYGDEYY